MIPALVQKCGCQIVVMFGKFLDVGNALEFLDRSTVHVTSARQYEAVRQDGTVLGYGDDFIFNAGKGDKVSFRPVKPAKARFTKAEIARARKPTTVTVVAQEKYRPGPLNFGGYEDGSLEVVIASLDAIRRKIPAQYRRSARCEIDSKSWYEDSHYASIEVTYTRPETDKEVIARLRDESAKRVLAERKEREQFAALAGKYGRGD